MLLLLILDIYFKKDVTQLISFLINIKFINIQWLKFEFNIYFLCSLNRIFESLFRICIEF